MTRLNERVRIVVAPDSFKGSLSALAVCEAVASGLSRALPGAEVIQVPLADGGEGTMDCLLQSLGGQMIQMEVMGPLGQPVQARFGLLGDGNTAIIESAEAIGLPLVPPHLRDPGVTTTYGVGQLIRAALDLGASRILLGLGGSSTQDGGSGMLEALGVRLLNADGDPLPRGGAALQNLTAIDWRGLDPRMRTVTMELACDVDTSLCGPAGTSRIFAAQKGADERMIATLDAAMTQYAAVIQSTSGRDVSMVPGGGAAGGLGAGLVVACAEGKVTLKSGIDLVMEAVQFSQRIRGTRLVITGEGRCDHQSALGKTISGVVREAGAQGVPVVGIVGSLGLGYQALYPLGLTAAFSIVDGPMDLDDALGQAKRLIAECAENIGRLYAGLS